MRLKQKKQGTKYLTYTYSEQRSSSGLRVKRLRSAIKSNLSIYSLYKAKAGNAAPFKEMLHRW